MDTNSQGRISRRSFLVSTLTLSGALAGAGLASPIIRYAYPHVEQSPDPRVLIATTADLEPLADTIDFEYQETPCSLLQLENGDYSAVSRVCTHFGCIISWRDEEKDFFCPCHAGIFSPTGEVLGGPPPRPLATLRLEVNEGGEIWTTGWQPDAQ
jgi:cytochrome b6-f complex iron-sulfur subunit